MLCSQTAFNKIVVAASQVGEGKQKETYLLMNT